MNLKKEIRRAAVPPEPKARDRFLKTLPYPKLTYFEFVCSQVGYIRKRIWLVSLAILSTGIYMVCAIPEGGMLFMWAVSAAIPFLAVLTAAEISRSNVFGMYEVEAGCQFSLPQIAGARMIILGICNFLVITAAAVLLSIFSPFGIARSALYILTPYLLVCGISLAIFDRTRGQEGVYLTGAAALIVTLMGFIMHRNFFDEHMINTFCIALCTAGAALLNHTIKKILFRKDFCYGIKN